MSPFRRLRGWCSAHPFWVDAALAVFVALLTVPALWGHPTGGNAGSYRDPQPIGLVFLLMASLPIAWRRVQPLTVLVIASVGLVAYEAAGFPTNDIPIGPLIALYTCATLLDRRRSLLAALIVAVGVAIVLLTARWQVEVGSIISNVVIFATVWFIGDNVRTRRQLLASLEDRAEQAEQSREEEARRAVADERVRIARELHDVVAHHMSVMILQSGAARRMVPRDPEQAAAAMSSVEETGREAMTEMRRMLGVLRATDDDPGAELAPQPSVRDLPDLLAHCADAGLDVDLVVDGEVAELPPGVDLSAYRIVQEALTNTLKHAGPARASVHVRYSDRGVELEISDDGRGASARTDANGSNGAGHGLVGMQERVEVFGGELRAGPRPGGGYSVVAVLPVEASP